jgi:putative aminopeptidase FrvX
VSRSLSDAAVGELLDLMRLPGLAGHEQPVAAYLRERFLPLADEVRTDTLGNLIATVHGSDPDAPTVMLFAHMDSLGFIVRRIDPDGYVWLHRLGGIPEKVQPGLRIVIGTADGSSLPGVIGVKAHHVTPPEEKAKVTPVDQLFVDVGASSRDEALAMGVRVGAPVTYAGHAERLGPHRVSGTFIDNRSGCLILLEVLRHLHAHRPNSTVHVVGSVQEEFNLRGASPAAHALQPDLAICIDGGPASDVPDLKTYGESRLGEGGVVNFYSFHGRGTLNGLIPHPALAAALLGAADRHGIPLQRHVTFGGLTDASYVQLVGDGIAAVDVGFPARYTHTPIETCDVRDMAGLVDVLNAWLDGLDAAFDLDRGDRSH